MKSSSLTPTRGAGRRIAGDRAPVWAYHFPLMAWTRRMTSVRIDFGCRTNQRKRSALAKTRSTTMNAVTIVEGASAVLAFVRDC